MTISGRPGDGRDAYASGARGVNNASQAAGYAWVPQGSGVAEHAVVFNGDGTFIDLGTLGGGFSEAHAINDAGQADVNAGVVNQVDPQAAIHPASAPNVMLHPSPLEGPSGTASGVPALPAPEATARPPGATNTVRVLLPTARPQPLGSLADGVSLQFAGDFS